ncbi:hypothetical protein [Pseudomonas sp. S1(2024)]|uniref:hypothetical protein n=1 Tax=Pseudomonas sp. S1(2024) TaxID=3390191 RepID=UPI0039793B55
MSNEDLHDVEVVADLLSLARSEAYKDVESFREAAHARWAAIGAQRVENCIRQLAEKLWDADYFNFRTEFQAQGRRKREAASKGQGSV